MELLSRRTARRVVSLLLLLSLAGGVAAATAPITRGEYEVKAAFVLNFASLVEWPSDSFEGGDALKVGILGDADYVEEVRSWLDGRSARSRVIRAEGLGSLEALRGHHVVFVTESADSEVEEVHAYLAGASVLLIGETEGFAQRGGAINFYSEQSRIRFEVNPKAVRNAGLRVSSRLFSVARVVE